MAQQLGARRAVDEAGCLQGWHIPDLACGTVFGTRAAVGVLTDAAFRTRVAMGLHPAAASSGSRRTGEDQGRVGRVDRALAGRLAAHDRVVLLGPLVVETVRGAVEPSQRHAARRAERSRGADDRGGEGQKNHLGGAERLTCAILGSVAVLF